MVWPAVIGAAGNLLGGIIGNKKPDTDDEAINRSEHWNTKAYDLAREGQTWNQNLIYNRVQDAKRAGIHPLFALGASGNVSTGFSAGSTPTSRSGSSGSALGAGIARAAGSLASGMRKTPAVTALQERLVNSQILAQEAQAHRDNTAADVARSEEARAIQSLNSSGAGRSLDPAPPLAERPIEAVDRLSTPRDAEYIREDGTRASMYHREAQMDEVNQARVVVQDAAHYSPNIVRRAWNLLKRWHTNSRETAFQERARRRHNLKGPHLARVLRSHRQGPR